jgi:transcriptional regulator with XRE-family HTH domain
VKPPSDQCVRPTVQGPATRSANRGSVNVSIGQNIAHFRQAAGLSLNDAARAIGVTAEYLADVETGLNRLTPEAIVAFAALVGLQIDDLFQPAPDK